MWDDPPAPNEENYPRDSGEILPSAAGGSDRSPSYFGGPGVMYGFDAVAREPGYVDFLLTLSNSLATTYGDESWALAFCNVTACGFTDAADAASHGDYRQAGTAVFFAVIKPARVTRGAFSRIVTFMPRQLEKGFKKHGADFGLTSNWNPSRAAEFSAAVNSHINSPGLRIIPGSYRGQSGFVHYLDPRTGLNVVTDVNGNFVAGFELYENQLSDLLSTGGFR
jgi:hypothetical protein